MSRDDEDSGHGGDAEREGRDQARPKEDARAIGPGGYCVCPACGVWFKYAAGPSCYRHTCPKCGAQLARP
jgi:hypothetical protein